MTNKGSILKLKANESLLSYGQKGLWLMYQIAPESVASNCHSTVKITSPLNINQWQSAWQKIIQRHSTLRTTFETRNGEPIQIVHPEMKIPLNIINASNWTKQKLKEELISVYNTVFDLENGPNLKVYLFQRSASEFIQVIICHHIISDMWSADIILKDMERFYHGDNNVEGYQYQDFVQWQSEMINSARGEKLWQYWQKELSGQLPILNLPIDKPRPQILTYRGDTYTFKLDQNLISQLKQMQKQEGYRRYNLLLAAFFILWFRYSNQEDILIGTAMLGRSGKKWFKEIFGYFTDPAVIRCNLLGDLTFKEFLTQVNRKVYNALKYHDYPFSLLTKQLEVEPDSSRNPIFQVSFVWKNHYWYEKATKPGQKEERSLPMQPYAVELGGQGAGMFDLGLQVQEVDDSLLLHWQYSTDLFNLDTIKRMAEHYHVLLSAIMTNPEVKISHLPILTEKEKHQLLVEWNDTQVDYPQDKCIHQLFEDQVEKTPDAIAVIYEDQTLTYRELNEKANQLGHYLHKLGVKPETLVGICLERSLEMIIGILGVLKASGVYVPFDTLWPPKRITKILNQANIKILLTQENLANNFNQEEILLISVDEKSKEIAKFSPHNLSSPVQPDQLAYVIFTSGSTSEAKGVSIRHRSVINLLKALKKAIYKEDYSQYPQRVSLNGSFAFDTSVKQIIQLLHGHTLDIIPERIRFEGEALLSYLSRRRINIFDCTPSQLKLLVKIGLLENPNAPKCILVGGEPIDESLWLNLSKAKHSRFYNVYGPTECTVDVTVRKIDETIVKPILGRPIANTKIYILDQNLQLLPIGVAGELHIGGAGLARGYLNRPKLTTEKFIDNPFGEGRLYKTGDLARYLPDGNIEFLGRIDNQVKIRGFRIELGEIEANLTQHPHIKEAIVIASENPQGNKYLTAYVIAKNEKLVVTPKIEEIRQFLAASLPEYMIPSGFIFLESFPLTTNGKIDRKSLPKSNLEQNRDQEFVAPRNETERILVSIWQDVLGLKKVSINDNFFKIGGDSIINLQVVFRAKEQGIQITPKQIFQHKTIAELALVAETETLISKQNKQAMVTGFVPLTPIQHRFLRQNWSEPHHFNQSVVLKLNGDVSEDLLSQSISKLLEHHDALRLRFISSETGWQQINQEVDNIVPFEVIDISLIPHLNQSKALTEIANTQQASLNLSQGPIMKVVLFNRGKGLEKLLLIIIHHLAVDGVSWRILLEDLWQAYQQLEKGEKIQLPAKTTSFRDWSIWLNEYANSSAEIRKELKYWLKLSASEVKSLPKDQNFALASNLVATEEQLSSSLTSENTLALLQEVHEAYNTQINDILLTALALTINQWTGQRQILIDLEGHGREELSEALDLSRTVGWFTSIFPVCLQISDQEELGATIKSIKEQLRAIPRRGIGYGILRYLNHDREIQTQLATLPSPEIVFNYLGQFEANQSLNNRWKLEIKTIGANRSRDGYRSHLLSIDALVIEGKLQVTWSYSRNFHNCSTIEMLSNQYLENLKLLISHCLSSESGGYTPSDFPEIDLDQQELDELLNEIN